MNVGEFVAELNAAGVAMYEEEGKLRYRAPQGVMTPERLETLRAHRDAVLALLRAEEYGASVVADPASAHEPFPLTDVQAAYLLGRSEAFDYGGVACHGYLEIALPHWGAARIEGAWNELIRRHPMLRAVVSAEGYQRVLPDVPHYDVRHEDLRGAADEVRTRALEATRGEMSHQVRQTDQWPLFDVRVTETDESLLLHVAVDLLICDYSGIRLLLAELAALCTGADRPEPLDATFRDYVLATGRVREGDRYRRDRDYWWSRIDDLPAAPDLPLRTDSLSAPSRFTRHGLRLTPAQWETLTRRSTEAGVTASGVLLQAFAETVGRWSRHPRFTLSLTVQNRLPLHPDTDRVIGDFSSTSLLCVDLTEGTTVADRMRTLQARLWEDMDHRLCSGVEVLRELARRRGRAEALLPVTFTSTVSGGSAGAETVSSLMPGGELVHGITQTPQVWIDCQVMEDGGGLLAHWDVREGVFPDGMVDDMFAAFSDLVMRLVDASAVWEEADPLALPARQTQRVADVNATAAAHRHQLLHTAVVEQAERTPDRAALITSSRSLSYAELLGRARTVAEAVRDAGGRPGQRVGIVMEKGWEQVVAVLGVLLADCAYLPVDTTQPALRRNAVLTDAEAHLVLTQDALLPALGLPEGMRAVAVDTLAPVDPRDHAAPRHRAVPDDLAYVIYTSGSTGTPKGVMISHAAALNTIDDINTRFSVTAEDRVLGLAQLGFDLSVYDIFGPLSTGGALVLPDAARRGDPGHWAELLTAHAVTVWNSVPAQMQMLEEYLRTEPGADVSRLRLAMLSGDWIPVTLPDAVRRRVPGLNVVSLGGATEAAIWSICHPVTTVDAGARSIPYGRPLANQRFHVLDTFLRECPIHVTGELYIAGAGLALGYLGDPERTAERFVTHPVTGERLYRTGDMGRRLDDGEIEFLGRVDRQVKLNGHRVELAEVEAALQAHPAVEATAATVQGEGTARRLVAFAEPVRTEAPELPAALREKAAAGVTEAVHAVEAGEVTEMVELLDVSALQSMAVLFRSCGLFPDATAEHTAEEVIEAVGAAPENHYLVRRWLAALEQEGRVVQDADTGRYRELREDAPGEHEAVLDRIDALEPRIRWGAELVRYHRVSEQHLAPLVRNEIDLKTLLFPEGRLETAEAAYRDNLISRHNNAVVVAALREIAQRHGGPEPLRLLEIGAGVGGTSTVLVPELDGLGVDYLFTDLSHFFLTAAQEKFQDFPWVRYGLFDLNRDYRAQGLAPNSFDVILLANVLHNSVHAEHVLTRLRELLAPGGWLVFIEATRDAYHVMTSMEFNAGLHGFEDERRETGQTFFGRDQWLRMLGEAGAEVAFCLPEEHSPLSRIGQHVFVSRFKADRTRLRPEALVGHLRDRLPSYMIPAELQVVDGIPLTGNGKVDRARLDAWTASAAQGRVDEGGDAPRDDMEQTLAELWTDVLPVAFVGRDANFFDLGGDSLLVARLVTRMRERLPEAADLEWDDLLRLVMNRPTVAALAQHLGATRGSDPALTGAVAVSPLVRLSDGAAGAPDTATRVMVHDGTGTLVPYRAVIRELGDRLPLAGLVVDDIETFLKADPRTQVAKLAERHAEALLAAGLGKVHLVGYCMGGLLVPELARRLTAAGAEVTGLTVISSYRVPYLVEDDLLAEYIFARLMRADLVGLGYPKDESTTRDLVRATTEHFANTVPQGSLVDRPESALTGPGREALRAFRALAERPQEERLRAIGASMPVEDAGLRSEERLSRLYRIVKHSLVSVALHEATPCDLPATFVRQTGEAEIFPGMHRDMTEYWQQVCGDGLNVVDVPGDHFTCVQPPNAQAVARALLSEDGR
ncbi:non-ribosomal peptide synthetase [Streptomyces roseochromogenus]|uniref:Phenyloxazoline synthase MbtB n=1 Tax=Streptomyces roseochromogenus subsp. oscitans DS 12.976 TaxID=1352936 RepID=V6KL09_STRRC|nr:non-ribosomal peptide synthetase [Streptomyces roseochromogenus]EST32880.1 tyrocidine synthetase 3 [Streptomyces roseochromogenus subsp. oscitans DS 12.976]